MSTESGAELVQGPARWYWPAWSETIELRTALAPTECAERLAAQTQYLSLYPPLVQREAHRVGLPLGISSRWWCAWISPTGFGGLRRPGNTAAMEAEGRIAATDGGSLVSVTFSSLSGAPLMPLLIAFVFGFPFLVLPVGWKIPGLVITAGVAFWIVGRYIYYPELVAQARSLLRFLCLTLEARPAPPPESESGSNQPRGGDPSSVPP
jgi:hypothetical protein